MIRSNQMLVQPKNLIWIINFYLNNRIWKTIRAKSRTNVVRCKHIKSLWYILASINVTVVQWYRPFPKLFSRHSWMRGGFCAEASMVNCGLNQISLYRVCILKLIYRTIMVNFAKLYEPRWATVSWSQITCIDNCNSSYDL